MVITLLLMSIVSPHVLKCNALHSCVRHLARAGSTIYPRNFFPVVQQGYRTAPISLSPLALPEKQAWLAIGTTAMGSLRAMRRPPLPLLLLCSHGILAGDTMVD